MNKYKELRRKNIGTKKIVFVVIILFLVGMVYAINDVEIEMKGTLGFKKSWDVTINNIVIKDGSVTGAKPVVLNENDSSRIEFDVDFRKLDDYLEFNFDVINSGAVDAKVYSLLKQKISDKYSKYYNYGVYWEDGTEVKGGDIIKTGETKSVKVRVNLINDDTINIAELIGKNYTGEDRSVSLVFDIAFRQV